MAAQSIPEASYVQEVYRTLQREGYRFPPKQEVVSSMYESSAVSEPGTLGHAIADPILQPPEWTDSDVCMRCREKFTFTNRKHHCRNCGNCFCGACSAKNIALPRLGIVQPVRVDDGCYLKLTDKDLPTLRPDVPSNKPHRTLFQGSMQPREARVTDSGFDADLRRALEMSLEESSTRSDAGYVSQAELRKSKPTYQPRTSSKPAAKEQTEHDLDADLEAAIAASLKEAEDQKHRHAADMRQNASAPPASEVLHRNTQNELTPMEAENINLFSTLVDRLQHQPPGTILREPRIQELYESIGKLRPKLARSYGETMSKHGKPHTICTLSNG